MARLLGVMILRTMEPMWLSNRGTKTVGLAKTQMPSRRWQAGNRIELQEAKRIGAFPTTPHRRLSYEPHRTRTALSNQTHLPGTVNSSNVILPTSMPNWGTRPNNRATTIRRNRFIAARRAWAMSTSDIVIKTSTEISTTRPTITMALVLRNVCKTNLNTTDHLAI